MSSRRQTVVAPIFLATMLLMPLAAGGQSSESNSAAYRPGLGDLMTMTVQPRHLKVGLAGREHNWAYATYAVQELEEALERVARATPKWRDIDVAGSIASTREPIEALEAAAKARDAGRFDETYSRLTATCNACHQSANRGMIVIQAPTSSPFANQDFRPAQP